jgi:hypothetical protein
MGNDEVKQTAESGGSALNDGLGKTVYSFCKNCGVAYHTTSIEHAQYLHDKNKGIEDCFRNLEVV